MSPILIQRLQHFADRIASPVGGDSPGEGTDDERVQRRLFVYTGLTLIVIAVVWGIIYAVLGILTVSGIAAAYLLLTVTNFAVLARTRGFHRARTVQIVASIVTPCAVQVVLGGWVASGGLGVWTLLVVMGAMTYAGTPARWLTLALLTLGLAWLFDRVAKPPAILDDPRIASAVFFAVLGQATGLVAWLTMRLVHENRQTHRELEAKNRILRETHAALVEREKMAALGQLVAGIAHELNTPLGAILASAGNIASALPAAVHQMPSLLGELSTTERVTVDAFLVDVVRLRPPVTSREERQARRAIIAKLEELSVANAPECGDLLVDLGVHALEDVHLRVLRLQGASDILRMAYDVAALFRNQATISTAAERAKRIVFALKTYAHPGTGDTAVEGTLADNLDSVVMLYHNHIKRGVELFRDFQEPGFLLAHHDQLNQVWTNLVSNALQATVCTGRLRLGIRGDADALTVEVEDNGPGIPPELLPRVFDAFYTTKAAGEGTGLGLAISHDIVVRHGGTISVDSRPGRTVFSVRLPRVSILNQEKAA